jgi:SAM-dependent methyltransferase
MDMFMEGLQHARRRSSCPLVQGDVHNPPFGRQFDVIALFDVLEHLPDDLQVLRDLQAILAPGGTVFITVPAHPSLWSYFDDASHHCRRYQPGELERKLIAAGYLVEFMTQYMASIFPLIWLGRRLAALKDPRPKGDATRTRDLAASELRVRPVVNSLLTFLLNQEARLIARRRTFPIGASLVALAHRA